MLLGDDLQYVIEIQATAHFACRATHERWSGAAASGMLQI